MKQFMQSKKIVNGRYCHQSASLTDQEHSKFFALNRQLRKGILIMKITGVLLLVACMHVSANVFSQNITLTEKNVSLETVLKVIQKQTGYALLYSNEVIGKSNPVTVDFKSAPLKSALDQIFENQPLTYRLDEKTILIKEKEPSIIDKIKGIIKTVHVIRGIILTKDGQPLGGATVQVKDSKTASTSNERGGFSISIDGDDAILVISYVGYITREIPVTSASDGLTIRLVVNESQLDAVQIIAYGTTTARLNTGSVSTITAADISKQPVLNPLQALEGRMSGVYITQNSGISGSNYNIQIEGQNSLRNTATNNGNLPLYVIDGVPYNSATLSTQGLAPYSGTPAYPTNGASPLNSINPQDIESITILKDADATSIYGSRGANGVVLITTKKGKAGEMQVDANVYAGAGDISERMDLLNLGQYLEMRNEALKNDNIAKPGIKDYDINGAWDQTRSTDWQKELLGGTAKMTDAQLTLSGGNSLTQYRIGAGYHRETSVFEGDNSTQRGTFSINITNRSANNKFKSNIGINYAYNLSDLIGTDLTSAALTLAPDAPALYTSSGGLNWQNNTFQNPLASTQTPYTSKTYNLIANGNLSYEFAKNLILSTNLGYTNTILNELKEIYTTSVNPQQALTQPLKSLFGNNSNISWIIEPQLNWDKMFGKNHVHLLLGGTLQDQVTDMLATNAFGFISKDQMENPGAAPSNDVTVTRNYADYKYAAIFGRITYDWNKKYLLDLTARRDGSSRFGPDKQFANFGAVGGAWIFSSEDFAKQDLPFLSFGKLRASYGITGSDQIGNYQYLNDYGIVGQYQGVRGLLPLQLYNPDFQWEVNKKIEAAIELGFLKDRLLATISYYRNRSSDQLIGYPLAPTTGFGSIEYNLPATVQNTGTGIELTSVNIKNKDFKWSSNFNITIPQNKLISFPDLAGSSYADQYVVGQPLSIQKSYTVTGVDPKTGLYVVQDVNKDGQYDNNDYSSIKNIGQQFYGGLGNSLSYKNFQFDFFFQFVKQNGKNVLNAFGQPGALGNQPVQVLQRWQNPGDITNIQRYGTIGGPAYLPSVYYDFSNENVTDASFIRLKNVAFSYRLPSPFLQKLNVKNCRIYVQGQNVLTFTKYLGLDPETQGTSLPPLRYITAGLQITL
ncbi:SusC/RagA family TonB-linked outer membrane protein [Mucilaginibacter sp. L196]|uniref:SusC/RagA family TonB-linked outer membrane protein n=1 Tax=Mucilaginibacter sp. L196 TaxID=1641870 RepID=UPI00131B7807|nr:SusC/RagA family TonB-linked outer membrane protein [Mucilaginibacter sp. L196]